MDTDKYGSDIRNAKPEISNLMVSASLRLCGVILLLGMAASAQWVKQTVDTTASLRGLSVVNEKVVWASGTGGTVIRTVNGGKTWKVMIVPGAEKLDFRDIEAFDANTAYILSIGNGESSRIYKTIDAGKTWTEQFRNKNEKAFFDAIACWDKNNCIAMSDPVDGKFVLINTNDGGTNWRPMDTDKMARAKEGEAAFAASGTCLITQGKNNVFLVSGGTDARVFRSNNRGLSWFVADTPIAKGTPGSGIFSIAMFDDSNGIIVGGNYEKPENVIRTNATTADGGKTWQLGEQWFGYRSSISSIDKYLIVVGPTGNDWSGDSGMTWAWLDHEQELNAVDGTGRRAVWAVGPKGYVRSLGQPLGTKRKPNKSIPGHSYGISDVSLSHSSIDSNCVEMVGACSKVAVIQIRTLAADIDAPHKYVYSVSGGKIVGEGPNVAWDLTGVPPGKYTITAGFSEPFGGKWGVWSKTVTKVVVVQ